MSPVTHPERRALTKVPFSRQGRGGCLFCKLTTEQLCDQDSVIIIILKDNPVLLKLAQKPVFFIIIIFNINVYNKATGTITALLCEL